MKLDISEQVAAGAVAALRESTHPDVRHLARVLRDKLSTVRNDIVTAEEFGAVMVAIDAALVGGHHVNGDMAALLRDARPKIEQMRSRQHLREQQGGN